MELDSQQNLCTTPNEPQPYSGRLEYPPHIPLLPPPPQRQAAIVWMVEHLVDYRMQRQGRLTLNDYIDFLQRTRWKDYQKSPRQHTVGNYLDVIYLQPTQIH